MTEKLYYADSHLFAFTAAVTACTEGPKGYETQLDRTAFFPEGGGQLADTGYIGGARVLDVREKDGRIIHYTDIALTPGAAYACTLDKEQRLRRMQNHSGEHIVSGIAHRLHGCDNVGFHMGPDCMTIDFDVELTWDQLMEIETLANRAIRDDLRILASFPDEVTLAAMEYRSKLELTENVRIVEIEGIDRCACCAPHVSRTGEVGIIKILDFMRHRGGVRISLVCGMDALDDYRRKQENISAISAALSAKRDEAASAVQRILDDRAAVYDKMNALGMEAARLRAESFRETEGNLCVFDNVLPDGALRELANLLADKCGGMAAVFSGSDEEGYRYIICSRHMDLRRNTKAINQGIGGRGGGSEQMIQGRASGTSDQILDYLKSYTNTQ